ncbi:unnamed protein product, partial [Iphiclides podalirius]
MLHIFDTDDIINKIYFCTGLQLKKEDGLPTEMCKACLDNLAIAHNFKTLCLLAEETLKNVNSNINIQEPGTLTVGSVTDDISNTKDEFTEPNETLDIFEDAIVKSESNVKVRKSARVKMKVKKECAEQSVGTVRAKRGPYNKGGAKRVSKFKFRKLFCEPCGLKFASKQQSDEHKRDAHRDSERFVCEICGKVFVHRASHYTHVRSHQPPRHACDRCDYRTCQKHDLVKHLRIHTGVKMYQCEYCTASYHTSSNLTCHIRRYHERVRRFSCPLCDRGFYDRTKLNRHLDSHNDIKRFECDVCHACFTRRCYWKKHMQREHNISVPPQRPGRQKTNRQVGELTDSAVVQAVTVT